MELFETVVILSLSGAVLTAFLLFLKPIFLKKLSPKMQSTIWIVVLISMIIPIYRLIPEKEVIRIQSETGYNIILNENTDLKTGEINFPKNTDDFSKTSISQEETENTLKIDFKKIIYVIWLVGVTVFFVSIAVSYFVYVWKKKGNSSLYCETQIFKNAKDELKIKRNIDVRISDDVSSPMLVGVFFPVIYIPKDEIPDEMLKMVFLHELAHYKRKDLLIKWICLIINGIHFFNPFMYFLSKNLSEACESACDSDVTKNMNDEEKNLYMKTILTLAEK